jgi:protein TonB
VAPAAPPALGVPAPPVVAPAAPRVPVAERPAPRPTAALTPPHAPARVAHPRPAPPPSIAPPPPSSAAAATPPTAGGTAEGTALGSTTGVPGGAVGGLGDAPLSLRDVAAPPELVTRVVPEYPSQARARQIEGQVVLEVTLDRNGRVEDGVRVTRSVPALDAAAIAAVRQWRFRPARGRDGRPVRVLMEIPVRFVLR